MRLKYSMLLASIGLWLIIGIVYLYEPMLYNYVIIHGSDLYALWTIEQLMLGMAISLSIMSITDNDKLMYLTVLLSIILLEVYDNLCTIRLIDTTLDIIIALIGAYIIKNPPKSPHFLSNIKADVERVVGMCFLKEVRKKEGE